MRIVVNDIAASTGGAMTVLRDFYNCVCSHDRENQWFFILGEKYFEETDNVKILTLPEIKNSHLRKLHFDFISGRKFINRLKPDVVLSLQNIITFGVKAPQAVYIHQSIPFQTAKRFSFLKSEEREFAVIQHLIGRIIRHSAKRSDLVIVQTQWMKAAVCKKCRIPDQKVCTSLPQVKPFTLGTDAFNKTAFFYPTTNAIYKNNDCLFDASKILEQKGIPHRITSTLPPEQSRGSVTCIGRIPYEQVQVQYRQATLVFPSYIETFGYPLAEARMAGAIILAADTAFAREVLDGYENAYFFDPFQSSQLAELMHQVTCGVLERKQTKQSYTQTGDGWEQVRRWALEMKK